MIKVSLKKISSAKKRVGRGYGSKRGGHTVGRGQKGQKSRAGYKSPRPGFEGGAMPLSRRIPKLKGFSRNILKQNFDDIVISLSDLENLFEDQDIVSVQSLFEKGIKIKKSASSAIKILANGEISKKLTIKEIPISNNARTLIEKAGGKVE